MGLFFRPTETKTQVESLITDIDTMSTEEIEAIKLVVQSAIDGGINLGECIIFIENTVRASIFISQLIDEPN